MTMRFLVAAVFTVGWLMAVAVTASAQGPAADPHHPQVRGAGAGQRSSEVQRPASPSGRAGMMGPGTMGQGMIVAEIVTVYGSLVESWKVDPAHGNCAAG